MQRGALRSAVLFSLVSASSTPLSLQLPELASGKVSSGTGSWEKIYRKEFLETGLKGKPHLNYQQFEPPLRYVLGIGCSLQHYSWDHCVPLAALAGEDADARDQAAPAEAEAARDLALVVDPVPVEHTVVDLEVHVVHEDGGRDHVGLVRGRSARL